MDKPTISSPSQSKFFTHITDLAWRRSVSSMQAFPSAKSRISTRRTYSSTRALNRNQRISCLKAFCIFFAVGRILIAQTTSVQPIATTSANRDSSAIASLDQAFGLMASPAVRQNLNSVVVTGVISLPGNQGAQSGTFVVKFVGSHFLLSTSFGAQNTLYSALGGQGKLKVNGQSAPLKVSGATELGADLFPLLEPWSSYSDTSIGIARGKGEVIEGVNCGEIDIQRPLKVPLAGYRTDVVRIFLDNTAGHIRAVDYAVNQAPIYSPRNRMRVLYDDYRVLEGLSIPTTITRLLNGIPMTVLHIAAVDTSQTFDDSALTF